jgi:hypothetical protein
MTSRMLARLDCQYSCDATNQQAVILDLSLRGAFLASKDLPPNDSKITITVTTPHLKKPLTLAGEVVRGGMVISDHGRLNRFGVKFSDPPANLIDLIRKMIV